MTSDATPTANYDQEYYASLRKGTCRSALAVVPTLIELFGPRSVVDVGCGTGVWLSVFRQHGIQDVLGIDGPWIGAEHREIPEELFREHDLSGPIRLDRQFDLVLCLEVAEHLARDASAPLLESLTALGAVIVFSAAIPFQKGEGHVNEAWPSYWSELFAKRDFRCLDILRGRFWEDDSIEYWYRQNMFCYVASDHVSRIREAIEKNRSFNCPINIVHPKKYLGLISEIAEWSRYVDILIEQRRQAEAKLERQRRQAEAELERRSQVEVELERQRRQAEAELERRSQVEAELARIQQMWAWRLYQAARDPLSAARRVGARLRSG